MKTLEEREAIIKAMLESRVEKNVLLTEIRFILEDYFTGNLSKLIIKSTSIFTTVKNLNYC